ncbi:MAG TPA: preprotein translocase subunit SecE [Clostridiales bacterium]|nr:preprotein translocase subunit SecE [Clostridiales bacterium]
MAQVNKIGKKGNFIKNMQTEFKKIVWPSRDQVIKKTIVVLIIALILTILVFGLDTIYTFVQTQINYKR